MYTRELIYLMNDGGEIAGNEINETIHASADETEDDVKIYVRHTIEKAQKYRINGKNIQKKL